MRRSGYILEGSSDAVNWVPISLAPRIVGDKFVLDVPVFEAHQFYRIRSNRPPTLSAPASATVNIGETRQFTVTANDPDGDQLRFEVTGLPEGATFDPNAGLLTIRPSQPGVFDIAITASDGFAASTRVLRLTVPMPPVRTTTALRGRILDANSAAQGQTVPIPNVRVTLLTTSHATTTDGNGNFMLDGVPAGLQVLNLDPTTAGTAPDGSRYAGFREEVTLLSLIENIINRPLYLPRIASGSMTNVNTNSVTVVSNADIGVSITIPPNTAMAGGSIPYDGPISISEVPLNYAPAAMPEELQPSLVITLQPVGIQFAQPVPITFPNRDALDPNSEVDIWSLDAGTGVFVVVGTGKVSADGTKIETISGGVRATDWHFPLPTPPQTNPTDDDHGKGTPCPGGSSVLLNNGTMLTEVALPSYFSLGQERVFRLTYSSRQAEPFTLLSASFTQTARQPRPRYLQLVTEVDATRSEQRWFSIPVSGFDEASWVSPISMVDQLTGIRSVSIRAGFQWQRPGNPPSTRIGIGDVRTGVVNRRNSPYGAGWSIGGLQRIHAESGSSSVLLVEDVNAKMFSRGVALNQVPLFEQGQALPFPSTGNITTYGLAAADFNRDGILDLAVTQNGSATEEGIHIFTGTGRGSFIHLLRVPMPTTGEPQGLVSADFDRDGIADLAVSDDFGRRVIVFKGIGNGNFSQTDSILLSIRTPELHAADLDGNGSIDLVTVTFGTSSTDDLAVLLNDGAGRFTSTGTQDPLGTAGIFVSALADMNGDTRPDLVFGRGMGGGIAVSLNNGSGQFSPAMHFTGGSSVHGIACADYTGDGRPDVLAGSDTQCTLFRNTGGGVLQRDADPAFSFPGRPVRSFTDPTPKDIDGDGKMDAVFVSGAQNYFLVAYGDGMGGFDARAFTMLPSDGDPTHVIADNGSLQGVLVADFNGDGTNDVVATRTGNPVSAAVVMGKGARDFATPRVFTSLSPIGSSRNSVAGDFDRDGRIDLMVLTLVGDSVVEFSKGLANGAFAPHAMALPESAVPATGGQELRAADFDRDGNLDVIFSRGSPWRIIIAWGLGNGMFRQDLGGDSNVWVAVESGPSGNLPPINTVPSDFNGDGFVDYANVFVDRVSIHLYDPSNPRTFIVAAHTFVPFAGQIADAAATGDVNGDGRLDLFLLERDADADDSTLFYAVYAGNGNGSFTAVPQNFTGFTQGFTPPGGQNLIPVEYNVGNQFFREALLSDVNKDGFVDALFTSGNGAWLMTGDGSGRFNPPAVITGPFDRPAGPMALVDVDGDGFDELAVGEVDIFARGVAILPNVGGRQVFGAPITLPVPAPEIRNLHAFDADQDGKGDLIVFHTEAGPNEDEYRFCVLRNVFGQGTATNRFEGQFLPPPGDFTKLRVNEDGTYTRTYPDGTIVQFDTNGLHRTTTDRNGNVTQYQYVAGSDLLAAIIEPDGQQVGLFYLNGHLSSVQTPAGLTRFTFEADGPVPTNGPVCVGGDNRLTKVTLPDGSTRQFTYLDVRDEPPPPPMFRSSGGAGGGSGVINIGALLALRNPSCDLRRTGMIFEEIDGEGNTSKHAYNYGRLHTVQLEENLFRAIIPPLQSVITASRNNTSPATAIPPFKRTDFVGYYIEADAATGDDRQLIYKTGPNGKVTEFSEGLIKTTLDRDGNGLLTRLRLPSGHQFDLTYDGAGNVLTVDDNQTDITSFEYDPLFNQITKIIHPGGVGIETLLAYDAEGNFTCITTPEGRLIKAQYRGDGQILGFTNALGTVTIFEYGPQGRLQRIREGTGEQQRVTELEYDAAGRIRLVRDAENYVAEVAYFDSGLVRSITWPGGAVTTFQEDQNNDLTAAFLPATMGTVQHAWPRDGLRRITSYSPPGAPAIHYDYNVHSEATALRAGGANLINVAYNDRGQITNITMSQPSVAPLTVTNTYNDTSSGLLIRAGTSDGITVIPSYAGEIIRRWQWSGALAGSFEFTFDDRYRITSDRLNAETPIPYIHDADGLLLTAGVLSLTRRPADGLVSAAQIGVLTETFAYNEFRELTNQTAFASGTPLFSASYTRDRLGRVTRTVEAVGGTSAAYDYEYDAGCRLSSVSVNGILTETFIYDARGNLVSDSLNGAYEVNSADQLLSAGGTAFTYTGDGSRLTKTHAGQTTTTFYTAGSHLRRVELPAGRLIDYGHDGMLNRTIKQTNGVVAAKYLCPSDNLPVAELNAANQIVSRFVYGTRVNMPEYLVKGGATYRIIADQLGSARLVVDISTGIIVQQLAYDAFGRVVMDTAPGFQPFGFAGGRHEPDTGLVRFGARDYDPAFRRWTTRDPIGLEGGGVNLYAYVFNEPVNEKDPTGTNPDSDTTTTNPNSPTFDPTKQAIQSLLEENPIVKAGIGLTEAGVNVSKGNFAYRYLRARLRTEYGRTNLRSKRQLITKLWKSLHQLNRDDLGATDQWRAQHENELRLVGIGD